MEKFRDLLLFTPGPVSVSTRVLSAGSRPMLHHRTPEFRAILGQVVAKMKILFGTEEDVLLIHATGRGAMEGVLRNMFSPGEKILCICNGKFGLMFAEIAEACDLEVTALFEDWLKPVNIDTLDTILGREADIKGVTVVHSDTSNAILNPVGKIGNIVRKHNRLLIADCVSSLGAMEFKLDEWKVDAAVTASQKGLMTPAGLSFVAINKRGWKAVERAAKPGYYINFKRIKKIFDQKGETPTSTPVSLVTSTNEALEMIFEEGPKNVFRRHVVISAAIKRSLIAMGLELLPGGKIGSSSTVSWVRLPGSTSSTTIKNMARDQYGILLATGLGDFKESTLRIGHLGMITVREALLLVSVLELILHALGIIKTLGKGLEAFDLAIKNKGGPIK
jgi:aspartate aminotransferase-like enzyme